MLRVGMQPKLQNSPYYAMRKSLSRKFVNHGLLPFDEFLARSCSEDHVKGASRNSSA